MLANPLRFAGKGGSDEAGTRTLTPPVPFRRRTGGHLGVVTIRNVDDDVIAALKARARANHRSLEGELRYLLERSATPRPALGLVRERARMAARYRADSTVATTASDIRVPEAELAGSAPDTGPGVEAGSGEWMGAMSDLGEIVGDIVSPATDPSEWAALRPDIAEPNGVDKP